MNTIQVHFLLRLVVILFILSSCVADEKPHSKKNFSKLNWLEGNWKGRLNNGIYYESWKKESPDLLTGKSYFIEGNDTIMSESARIKRDFTNVEYQVKVGDEEEVSFILDEITDALTIFENPLHDFPQRIIYIKKDNDHFLTRIEGADKGKKVSEEIRLTRQK